MRYIWHHAGFIIDHYNGGIPLSHFLKNYFRQQKQLGSRDRKIVSEMAYCWYRCSKALPDSLNFEEKMQACLFICETYHNRILQFLPESWQGMKNLNLADHMDFLQQEGISFHPDKLAPATLSLSEGINLTDWVCSMLQQPRLFIRLRKDTKRLLQLLKENEIDYEIVREDCLSLPNGAPIDKILPPELYVVQDASSQQTGKYFKPLPKDSWWDCCCGAGGKSLLLMDKQTQIKLTVSDKRTSILHNLSERFRLYKHHQPEQIVVDVSDENALKQQLGNRLFDHIICDVPCSGAGTWARTPEQLYFFEESKIAEYASLQKKIAVNASQHLKPGGTMIYITCSVFREENENVVDWIQLHSNCKAEQTELINGISIHADSMFAAVFKRELTLE